jgi:glycosyltransferase involved in cell wall biosynthesis
MVAPELWGLIRKARFDALIVHGYAVAANLVAIAAANSVGTPVLMRGETHLGLSRVQLSGPKSQAIRTVLSRCSAFLAIGSANAAYYRAMGIAPERIFLTPYTIDNDRFARMSAMDPDMRAQARRDLGVEDAHPILLYAAKFQRRKHPDDVLRAAAKLKAEGLQFHVAMVGSGEMAGELKSLTQSLGLDNVRFHGFVNQSLLPRVYAACDAFILPSEEEPWGLAVNEAMACGLPVVVSAEVGCVPDLVTPGVSGQTFQAGDVDGLADALRPLTADAAYRQRMAAGARDAINRWSYREASAGIQAAIEFVQRKKAA